MTDTNLSQLPALIGARAGPSTGAGVMGHERRERDVKFPGRGRGQSEARGRDLQLGGGKTGGKASHVQPGPLMCVGKGHTHFVRE